MSLQYHFSRDQDPFDQGPYYYGQDYGRNASGDRNRGRSNQPNYGNMRNENNGSGRYGYNQGRNSQSNAAGRGYGQSYDQYHQGSYGRQHNDPDQYAGDFDPEEQDSLYNQYSSDNSRGFYEQTEAPYQYRDYGFQGQGHTEGFGHRSAGRFNNYDEEEGIYPGGHSHHAYRREWDSRH